MGTIIKHRLDSKVKEEADQQSEFLGEPKFTMQNL